MTRQPGAGLPKHYGRSTRRYRTLRKTFRQQCEAANTPCWLCGMPIDYTAPTNHPDAFNLDHALSRHEHPHLAEDPGNFRAAHDSCNKSKGTKAAAHGLGQTSRQW